MVAIKDFGMPSCCVNCDMCLPCALDEGLCYLTQNTIGNIYDKRPGDCPLVEEHKVGKWIYDKTSQNWRCSECSETPKTLGYVGTSAFMTEHFKFCNHCGAEMLGVEKIADDWNNDASHSFEDMCKINGIIKGE